jgi:hypothetical protein
MIGGSKAKVSWRKRPELILDLHVLRRMIAGRLADLDAGEAVLVDPRGADVAVLASMLDEHRLRLRTDTVAIAFDMNTGKLHEHGSPTRIHSWAQHTRRTLGPHGPSSCWWALRQAAAATWWRA